MKIYAIPARIRKSKGSCVNPTPPTEGVGDPCPTKMTPLNTPVKSEWSNSKYFERYSRGVTPHLFGAHKGIPSVNNSRSNVTTRGGRPYPH